MDREFWAALGLTPASHADLAQGVDDVERQPAPYKMAFPAPGASQKPAVAVRQWQDQEPVERIVNSILMCAIRDGATDIHIQPQPQAITVRYRVKGEFRDHLKLPVLVLEPLVRRFKYLGQLDESARDAQWGMIKLKLDEYEYDLQIATAPTEFGESVLLRVSCARP